MSVSTVLLVVTLSVVLVALKKVEVDLSIGKVQPQLQRTAQANSTNHMQLRSRLGTLGDFT